MLTAADRDVIARARKLMYAGDLRAHTGEPDLTEATILAFREARELLGELTERLEQLGS